MLRWASHAHQPTVTDRSRILLQFDGPKGHVQLLVMANTARNPLDISLYEGLCKAGHTAGKIPSAGSSPAPAVVPAEASPIPGDTVARGTMRLDHSLSADWRSRLSTGAAAEGAGGAASAMPAAGR